MKLSRVSRWLLLVVAPLVALAVALLLLWGNASAQSLYAEKTAIVSVAVDSSPDTLFVPFPPYRAGQPLEPVNGWARFDSIVAASGFFDIKFIGTADAQTKSYKNLGKKVEFEAVLQRPLNRDYAVARGDAGVNRAGCGEAASMIVELAKDRGIFIVRTPLPSLHVAEASVPQSLKMPSLYDGYPGDSDPLDTLVKMSDGNAVPADVRFSIADTSIARVVDGRVVYIRTGQTELLAEYGEHHDSSATDMRADGNGMDGHDGVYLKNTATVRVLKFPESPKSTSFLGFNRLSAAIGGSAWKSADRNIAVPSLELRLMHKDSTLSLYGGIGRDVKSERPDQLGSRYDLIGYIGIEYLLWKGFGITGQSYVARSVFSSGKYDGDWAESGGNWDFAFGPTYRNGRFYGRLLYANPTYTLATQLEGERKKSLLLQFGLELLK